MFRLPRIESGLVAEFPDISILVNNAGLQVIAPIIESTPQDIEYELTVNFLAPVLLCRAYLPHLVQRKSAAIVNVSSGLALCAEGNLGNILRIESSAA